MRQKEEDGEMFSSVWHIKAESQLLAEFNIQHSGRQLCVCLSVLSDTAVSVRATDNHGGSVFSDKR